MEKTAQEIENEDKAKRAEDWKQALLENGLMVRPDGTMGLDFSHYE